MPDTATNPAPSSTPANAAPLLVCLPDLSDAAQASTLDALAAAFPTHGVLVATPRSHSGLRCPPQLSCIPYAAPRSDLGWMLTAADYASAGSLAAEHKARAVLLLSCNAETFTPTALRSLITAVDAGTDLALPRYLLGPRDGLVNAAILYPLSRALFGNDVHFPFAMDVALSPRLAQRLTSVSQSAVAGAHGGNFVWPVAEATLAGCSLRSVDVPGASPAPPPPDDFNALFATIAGSLFADIELKAALWQRSRNFATYAADIAPAGPRSGDTDLAADVASMIETFHLAHNNLQEIWAIVLPPQTRLALKKLSQLPPRSFAMDPGVWARVVYDFVLAFHLRTLNRGHLLGAMVPLYMAWAASHLLSVGDDASMADFIIQNNARAFERERSYFVARWRWPDRFTS